MADKSKDKDTLELELFDMSVASAPMVPPAAPTKDAKRQVISTLEALEVEGRRKDDEIHLFVRGMFYRAYNSSAWMVSSLFRADFRILRDRTAEGTAYVYLGFPVGKLTEVFADDCETEDLGNHVVVTVKPERRKGMPSYEQWLSKVKIKDRKETELPPDADLPIGASLRIANAQDIALRLATYHIESHTMLENIQFLSSLISAIKYN